MLRFLADENFNGRIYRGLLRRLPELEIVRAQDVGLEGVDDPDVLQWAAEDQRIVLTHDLATMAGFAYDRVRQGQPMPGLFEVPADLSIGRAIEDLVLLAEMSLDGEWDGQVRFLPL